MDTSSRPIRRALLSVLAVALLGLGAAACAPPGSDVRPAVGAQSPDAARGVALVNLFRGANGLGPLVEAGDATGKAQMQANSMAAAGAIFHSDLTSGIQPGWSALGENVGYGANVDDVQARLEASAPHRANMLSTAYNQIGVGVAYANGQVYVAQEFVGR